MCLFYLVNIVRKIKELLYIIYFDYEDVNYLNEYLCYYVSKQFILDLCFFYLQKCGFRVYVF